MINPENNTFMYPRNMANSGLLFRLHIGDQNSKTLHRSNSHKFNASDRQYKYKECVTNRHNIKFMVLYLSKSVHIAVRVADLNAGLVFTTP